jgi:hypothetical protein
MILWVLFQVKITKKISNVCYNTKTTCPDSWISYKGSCYYLSTGTITDPHSISWETLKMLCKNQTSARLAILFEKDVPITFLGTSGSHYFDFYRELNSSTFYSSDQESSSTYNSSIWKTSWDNNNQCAKFSNYQFEDHLCPNGHSHPIICEIVIS